ncbi:MAG: polysaccharide deacetylase family protein [Verrucomicrobiota bacterium]
MHHQSSTPQKRLLLIPCILLSYFTPLGWVHADEPPATHVASPLPPGKLVGNKIELLAARSEGGNILENDKGEVSGVTLDKSCAAAFKTSGKEPGIDWKTEPLPAGWWHGVVESNQPRGYANRDIGIMFLTKDKSSVKVAANFDIKGDSPKSFEFWIYIASPAEGVRMQPDSDLWNWNQTWPISKITLEQRVPTILEASLPVTLELPVNAGEIILPPGVPGGNWIISGILKKAGTASFEGADGRSGHMNFTMDQWKTNVARGANFYLNSSLKKITTEPEDIYPSVVLTRNATRVSKPLDVPGELMVTQDSSKPVAGVLEMIGSNLAGEPPVFAAFPGGKRIAVMTTWDDGPPEDLRLAEILNRQGYRPTFFMNHNSKAIGFLDQLIALNVEIGSHGYNHPFLYRIPPGTVKDECSAMRRFLETKLGHPVVSYAYPNGYSPAYDVDGDYVLRGVEAAGYWSGRTTNVAQEMVDSIRNPLMWQTDGFFGNSKPLEAVWEKTKTKEGAIFYFWGHSWQIGKTDADWTKFETFSAQFAGHPDAWYASQGAMSVWLWARKNVQVSVLKKSAEKVSVEITRPWIHPYLSAQCPLAFTVPAGVEKVTWQGKVVPVIHGKVDLAW